MDDLQRDLAALLRQREIIRARERMLPFMKLIQPDPDDPENPEASQYVETPLARLLCQVIEKVDKGEEKRVCVSVGPQMGKALEVGTLIPTPKGWQSIVSLQPGDEVFDENGDVCRVVAKSGVFLDRPVYEVRTDDGFSVLADAEHEWPVRMSRSHPVVKLKTSAQLSARTAERNVRVRIQGAIKGKDAQLPIDPYVLGAWLGDGSTSAAIITGVGADGEFIERQVAMAGYRTRRLTDPKNFGVLGLFKQLRLNRLLGHKHIPALYLRAGQGQRLALLQGLVDTDGHVTPKGHVEVVTVLETLAVDIRELVLSLGYKCQLYEKRAMLDGRDCGPKWSICFYMPDAARLPRKRANCREAKRYRNRYLTVQPAGVADTVCIQVDSPSRLYLCGQGMLVTHNSQVLSRGGPAWLSGRRPSRHMILGSYNDTFAQEFGGEVRSIMRTPAFSQVFPKHGLQKGSEAKNLLITNKNGKMAFVGVGGSGTGKPADIFFVDDPIKSDEDAASEVFREKLWTWFNRTVFSRCHNDSAVIVVHTRWHEDDLIGRLCDPTHPERHKKYKGVADQWKYYNLPAVVEDPDLAAALDLTLAEPTDPVVVQQFGKKPMVSLWEKRKGLRFLAEAKQMDAAGFGALYMGQPTPPDGEYFTLKDIVEYDSPKDLPAHLRVYCGSDHATGEKQRNDYSVLGAFGVDENDDIWVLPDFIMDRMKTDQIVDEMMTLMERHKPLVWWMEDELISKSFGPFLMKRMNEEEVYTTLEGVSPGRNDLEHRARAIQGRMRMQKVHFPNFHPKWAEAKGQLLKFPKATHDDFVSFLAIIGLGLAKTIRAQVPKRDRDNVIRVGSLKWIMNSAKSRARKEERVAAVKGW